LVCKWATDSRSAWFSYSRCLRIVRTSSMDVDMIMNIVKYDTNKRWVIHNLNQQFATSWKLFYWRKGVIHIQLQKESNS
jgi:hypothetical protein